MQKSYGLSFLFLCVILGFLLGACQYCYYCLWGQFFAFNELIRRYLAGWLFFTFPIWTTENTFWKENQVCVDVEERKRYCEGFASILSSSYFFWLMIALLFVTSFPSFVTPAYNPCKHVFKTVTSKERNSCLSRWALLKEQLFSDKPQALLLQETFSRLLRLVQHCSAAGLIRWLFAVVFSFRFWFPFFFFLDRVGGCFSNLALWVNSEYWDGGEQECSHVINEIQKWG